MNVCARFHCNASNSCLRFLFRTTNVNLTVALKKGQDSSKHMDWWSPWMLENFCFQTAVFLYKHTIYIFTCKTYIWHWGTACLVLTFSCWTWNYQQMSVLSSKIWLLVGELHAAPNLWGLMSFVYIHKNIICLGKGWYDTLCRKWTRQLEIPTCPESQQGIIPIYKQEEIGSLKALCLFSLSVSHISFLSCGLTHKHTQVLLLLVFYPQGRLSYWICRDFAIHLIMHAKLMHTGVKALKRCRTMYKHSLFILKAHINKTYAHSRAHSHSYRG